MWIYQAFETTLTILFLFLLFFVWRPWDDCVESLWQVGNNDVQGQKPLPRAPSKWENTDRAMWSVRCLRSARFTDTQDAAQTAMTIKPSGFKRDREQKLEVQSKMRVYGLSVLPWWREKENGIVNVDWVTMGYKPLLVSDYISHRHM